MQRNLANYKEFVQKACTEKELLQKQLIDDKRKLQKAQDQLETCKKVRSVFQEAAIIVQNTLSEHISNIVTGTINAIFPEKDIEFKAEFVERRNKTECDLYVIENGHKLNLLDSKGHGMADAASMALRVAVVSLDSVDNVLILDEPFRNLDRARHPLASELIKELSKELDMQFIIVTHVPDLVDCADKHIQVKMVNGVSHVN